jgi:hypothetical protein
VDQCPEGVAYSAWDVSGAQWQAFDRTKVGRAETLCPLVRVNSIATGQDDGGAGEGQLLGELGAFPQRSIPSGENAVCRQ